MRRLFLFLFISYFAQQCFAQQDSLNQKEKQNCISIYIGICAFNQYIVNKQFPISIFPFVEGNYNPFPQATDLLISFKHNKHEFTVGLYGTTYYAGQKGKFFIFGGGASYIYHFSKKKTHLLFEGNFKLLGYSTFGEPWISPYNSTIYRDLLVGGYQQNAASICTIAVHPAIGLEVKLWKCIYYQFAVGSGFYRIKAHKVFTDPAFNGFEDRFTSIYSPRYGLDWYARMSLVFRLYRFN